MNNDLFRELIRAELNDYLTGVQTLQEFCDEFFPITWDIHLHTQDQKTLDMVYDIKLTLDEYSSLPQITEEKLKEILTPWSKKDENQVYLG